MEAVFEKEFCNLQIYLSFFSLSKSRPVSKGKGGGGGDGCARGGGGGGGATVALASPPPSFPPTEVYFFH